MRRGMTVLVLVLALVAGACAEAEPTAVGPLTVDVFAAGAGGHAGPGAVHNYRTHATGAEEVPVRDTRAQGQAVFQLSADGTRLSYRLMVANIENVTQAHIHLAPPGVNGPVVLWLYPSGPPAVEIPGRVQGVLGQGVATSADLVGPLAGMTLADLVAEIETGNAYVNVHTTRFPPGEIRGQID